MITQQEPNWCLMVQVNHGEFGDVMLGMMDEKTDTGRAAWQDWNGKSSTVFLGLSSFWMMDNPGIFLPYPGSG